MVMNIEDQITSISSYLLAFAHKLTQNTMDADDLFQDTVIKILTNREKFEEGTNFKAWCSTIMRNTFLNGYRRKKRMSTIIDTTPNNFLIDSTYFTLGEAETNLAYATLVREVNKLGKELREPFMMHFYGYKYDEIAEHLDVPLGTIKSRIFFARKELKKTVPHPSKAQLN